MKLLNALKVMILTPHIREYLSTHDPRGLEQAEQAIDEAEENGLKPLQVLVLGSNFQWAKGDTIDEALKGAKRPPKYIAYIVHPESTVTGMGAVSFPNGFAPKVIARKGC